jgi:hypothetical protein
MSPTINRFLGCELKEMYDRVKLMQICLIPIIISKFYHKFLPWFLGCELKMYNSVKSCLGLINTILLGYESMVL